MDFRVIGRRVAVFGVLLLAACATPMSRTTAFGEAQDKTLLVTASRPTAMATTIEFRRVDLETGRFLPEIVSIVNAGLGGNQMDQGSPIWMSPKLATPGDYAVVSVTTATFNGVAGGQAWRCFTRSPVYRLASGKISMIPVDEFWRGAPGGQGGANPDPATLLSQFERVRGSYPNVVGEPAVIAPVAAIHWKHGGGMGWTRNCQEPADFVVDEGG